MFGEKKVGTDREMRSKGRSQSKHFKHHDEFANFLRNVYQCLFRKDDYLKEQQ